MRQRVYRPALPRPVHLRRFAALPLICRPARAPVPANAHARDAADQTPRPRTPRAFRCASTPDDGESVRFATPLPIAHSSIRRSGKTQTHHSTMLPGNAAERGSFDGFLPAAVIEPDKRNEEVTD